MLGGTSPRGSAPANAIHGSPPQLAIYYDFVFLQKSKVLNITRLNIHLRSPILVRAACGVPEPPPTPTPSDTAAWVAATPVGREIYFFSALQFLGGTHAPVLVSGARSKG